MTTGGVGFVVGVAAGLVTVGVPVAGLCWWVYRHSLRRMLQFRRAPLSVAFIPSSGDLPWLLSVQVALEADALEGAPALGEGCARPADVYRWLTKRYRTFDVASSEISMVWSNHTGIPIVVTEVRAVVENRSQALHSSLFENPGGGPEPRVSLSFDLDSAHPQAFGVDQQPDGQVALSPYFAGQALHIEHGEQVVVDVVGSTSEGACEWMIEIVLVVRGRVVTQRVTRGGEPFRTAAHRSPAAYNHHWLTGLAVYGSPSASQPPYMRHQVFGIDVDDEHGDLLDHDPHR